MLLIGRVGGWQESLGDMQCSTAVLSQYRVVGTTGGCCCTPALLIAQLPNSQSTVAIKVSLLSINNEIDKIFAVANLPEKRSVYICMYDLKVQICQWKKLLLIA